MKIIESFIASKYGDMSLCEDGLFINDKYIAVIDGVTQKGELSWDGHASGFYAKELLIKALDRLNGDEPPEQVFKLLNKILYEQYRDRIDYFREHTQERLRATIVIYSQVYKQIWCFGDCQYMINGRAYQKEMKIDKLLAEVRSAYLHMELLSGKTQEELCAFDTSREIIFPIIQKELYFSNNSLAGEYAFSVMDGFCDNFENLIIENVEEGSSIVLASDGYPRLEASLEESELFIEKIKKEDPLCIDFYKAGAGFTNGKSAIDDRAYIKFIN